MLVIPYNARGSLSIIQHSKAFIKNVNHLKATRINFPSDTVLLSWYFETLPMQVKEFDTASTIITTNISLAGGVAKLNEEVINKQSLVALTSETRTDIDSINKFYSILNSYIPLKEARVNQILNNQNRQRCLQMKNGFSRSTQGPRFLSNQRFNTNLTNQNQTGHQVPQDRNRGYRPMVSNFKRRFREGIRCYKCGKEGHISRECRAQIASIQIPTPVVRMINRKDFPVLNNPQQRPSKRRCINRDQSPNGPQKLSQQTQPQPQLQQQQQHHHQVLQQYK
ncbi:hypothetical protein ACTFIW_005505 [Dictyostelium discoideum]